MPFIICSDKHEECIVASWYINSNSPQLPISPNTYSYPYLLFATNNKIIKMSISGEDLVTLITVGGIIRSMDYHFRYTRSCHYHATLHLQYMNTGTKQPLYYREDL